jgi:hypothetical protein
MTDSQDIYIVVAQRYHLILTKGQYRFNSYTAFWLTVKNQDQFEAETTSIRGIKFSQNGNYAMLVPIVHKTAGNLQTGRQYVPILLARGTSSQV